MKIKQHKKAPDERERRLEAAETFYASHDYEAALETYAMLLAESPDDASLQWKREAALYHLRHAATAAREDNETSTVDLSLSAWEPPFKDGRVADWVMAAFLYGFTFYNLLQNGLNRLPWLLLFVIYGAGMTGVWYLGLLWYLWLLRRESTKPQSKEREAEITWRRVAAQRSAQPWAVGEKSRTAKRSLVAREPRFAEHSREISPAVWRFAAFSADTTLGISTAAATFAYLRFYPFTALPNIFLTALLILTLQILSVAVLGVLSYFLWVLALSRFLNCDDLSTVLRVKLGRIAIASSLRCHIDAFFVRRLYPDVPARGSQVAETSSQSPLLYALLGTHSLQDNDSPRRVK